MRSIVLPGAAAIAAQSCAAWRAIQECGDAHGRQKKASPKAGVRIAAGGAYAA